MILDVYMEVYAVEITCVGIPKCACFFCCKNFAFFVTVYGKEANAMIRKKNYEQMIKNSMEYQENGKFICEEGQLLVYNFNRQYVGKVLERTDFWSEGSSHFISAGTGVGKTSMIFSKILPEVKARGKKILVLANRSSLTLHYKKEIMKSDNAAQHLEGMFTEKGLIAAENFEFGDFHVVTYQNVANLNLNFKNYGIVILDECHYFVTDSVFNRYTESNLMYLLKKCKALPKVFLSATPEECFFPIFYAESKVQNNSLFRPLFYLYHFEREFRNISPSFFVDKKTLKSLSNKNEKKWLIFVDSKRYGRELEDFFNRDKESTAVFLDAESKYNEKAMFIEELIENEDFKYRILIVTKAFDVGININTANLNVAIFSLDKTDFLQMMGRKRRKSDEVVEVFIYLYSLKEIENRIKKCEEELNEINKNESILHTPVYGDTIEFPYYAYKGIYQINHFTLLKKSNDLMFFKGIIKDMGDDDRDFYSRMGSLYLKWIDKRDENVIAKIIDMDSNEEIVNKIKKCMSEIEDPDNISEELFLKFGEEILSIENPRKDNRKERNNVTPTMINRVIKKVGYKIKKEKDKYKLMKIEED